MRSRHATHPDIVVATRIFVPEAAAATFRLDALTRSLAAAGARVQVLTSRPKGSAAQEDRGAVRIHRARSLRDRSDYIRGYVQYLSFDIPLLVRLLGGPRPDAMVVEPPPTTGAVVRIMAALRRVPFVYYAADVWSDAARSAGMPGPVVATLRAVERFALRGARSVIAINEGVAQRARALGAHDVHVVLNGIDTEVFVPQEVGAEDVGPADVGPRGRFLVYAGTASEWQGAGIFVDAFRLIEAEEPDLQLVYLGRGSDFEAIRARAKGDPRIHFIAQVPPQEAARWLAQAEAALVSIVPGRGYDFAYPTKVLAALSCGTPVVYAGLGVPARDIEEADLGEVADYSAGSVADAIRRVLGRPREVERLRGWVIRNRSLAATGRAAARVVLETPQG